MSHDVCSFDWLLPIQGSVDKQKETCPQLGLEMEMLVYDRHTLCPIGLPGAQVSPQSIFNRLLEQEPAAVAKQDPLTGLITSVSLPSGGNISCEPGGQMEYSSAPVKDHDALILDVQKGLMLLEQAVDGRAVFLSHGTNPIAQEDHPLVLPKERYQIMTRYFESAPQHVRGLDMMRHSATVQANIDVFGADNWQDAVRLTLVLIPLTAYLFANSKYFKNRKSIHRSERQSIWKHMDPSRSGYPMLSAFLPQDQLACTYAQWAEQSYVFLVDELSIHQQPLYEELRFSDWITQGYKGIKPGLEHWKTHLATLFPHLRLREFLEIRHIDAQPFEHTFAPIAFFSALISKPAARKRTWDLIGSFDINMNSLFSCDETMSFAHKPLLALACDILKEQQDLRSCAAIDAYSNFLAHKQDYWLADSPLDFVKRHATVSPSTDFVQFL